MFNMNITEDRKLELEASFKDLGQPANSEKYNAAAAVFAQAIQVPIREVVMSGDIIKEITLLLTSVLTHTLFFLPT